VQSLKPIPERSAALPADRDRGKNEQRGCHNDDGEGSSGHPWPQMVKERIGPPLNGT